MLHQLPAASDSPYEQFRGSLDDVGGYLSPSPPVPGPKEKRSGEFKVCDAIVSYESGVPRLVRPSFYLCRTRSKASEPVTTHMAALAQVRTVGFEKAAVAQSSTKTQLAPFVFTGPAMLEPPWASAEVRAAQVHNLPPHCLSLKHQF